MGLLLAAKNKKLWLFLLGIICLLLLGGLLPAAMNQQQSAAANEECIRCHVEVFNHGMESPELHPPFWERNCIACHLAEGSLWVGQENTVSSEIITGTLVDQNTLWRKLQSFSTASSPSFDHLVSLPSLLLNAEYRFRIVDSTMAKNSGGEVHTSLWLGLRPSEVSALGSAQQLDFNSDQLADSSNLISSASLYRSGETIFVAWKTNELLYGWIELQELEGVDLNETTPGTQNAGTTSTATGHPPMRDPEDLSIKACYQCHPESSLGTSHPVRLYGGRDVRIPEELPTVDGMLTCVTCHDPHGASGKMLVRETIKTKLCVACHYKYKNSSPSTMFQ